MHIDAPYIFAILAGSASVIAFLFHALMTTKNGQIAKLEEEKKEIESRRKSYEEIATEAVRAAQVMVDHVLAKEGKDAIVRLAPVVPESHSPSTAIQRDNALIATMRAQVAAIKLAVGHDPRPEPERAIE